MTQIRTKLGYAYAIGAGWDASCDHPGTFRIAGSTKSADDDRDDQGRARRSGENICVTSEVTRSRAQDRQGQRVLNSFVFSSDSPLKTLNRLVMYEY